MAAAGVASRRACEEIILNGKVAVNGKKALLPQMMVDISKDKVRQLSPIKGGTYPSALQAWGSDPSIS